MKYWRYGLNYRNRICENRSGSHKESLEGTRREMDDRKRWQERYDFRRKSGFISLWNSGMSRYFLWGKWKNKNNDQKWRKNQINDYKNRIDRKQNGRDRNTRDIYLFWSKEEVKMNEMKRIQWNSRIRRITKISFLSVPYSWIIKKWSYYVDKVILLYIIINI